MTTAPAQSHLILVKDEPAVAVEGVALAPAAPVEKVRPAWIESAAAVRQQAIEHVAANRLYLPWAARGYARLGACWVDAYRDDYPQMIATAREALRGADVEKQANLKERHKKLRAEYWRHRLTHVGQTAGWATAAGVGTTAAAMAGLFWVDLALAAGAYLCGVLNGVPEAAEPGDTLADGRGLTLVNGPAGPGVTPQGVVIEQIADDVKPFPVRQAATEDQLAVCVLAALRKEGIPVAEVFDISRRAWGWQCTVRVSEGTPEAIIKAAGNLETSFDLGTNRLRIQPLKERRACATLRLIEGDPFATAPPAPYRAPKSISITDRSRVGTSIAGDPLEISLAGVMGLIVAASGGGKTGILQSLAEVATACRDNITIDLDPFGDGLEDLHDAVRITARTTEQIEAVLAFFLVLAKARARLRRKLGMGNKWRPSTEHPAFTIFFDEFPKGSELSQLLTVELLLVGRKECVQVEIASQGATSRYLSENIAQMIALGLLGPCKRVDTNAVCGDGAAAEGWLPHRLDPATDTDPKDAGHVYARGVPGLADAPVEYAMHHIAADTLRRLAAERAEAGLVEPDQESLDAMADVDLPEIPGFPKVLSWPALLRLCGAEPPVGSAGTAPVVAEALAAMDSAGVDRMRTEILAAALDLTADELKAKMRAAGVPDPAGLGEMDGLKNPRGYKRDMLTRA